MSRLLLLLVFVLWAGGSLGTTARPPEILPTGLDTAWAGWVGAAVFFGVYGVLIIMIRLWALALARRAGLGGFGRRLGRFNRGMLFARFLIPAWFAVGVFGLGWAWLIDERLGFASLGAVHAPGLVLGTLPAVLAWCGLWWSQYPAERAVREQQIWVELEEGTPPHAPPTFREYFVANLRLQVLATLVPVVLLVGTRDVVSVTLLRGRHGPTSQTTGVVPSARNRAADSARADRARSEDLAELLTFLASGGVVFVFAPEILRRVFQTSPLPDGPLRRRLEALCRRTGMRYREILVWHTHFNMGNAAVTGVFPWLRYVMLSDLLLERLTDEQIEAVFAHEIGHIVHRHMGWFVVFFLILVLGLTGPASVLEQWVRQVGLPEGMLQPLILLAGAGAFCLVFGFLSRRFERQADVYAARVLESGRRDGPAALAAVGAPAGAPAGEVLVVAGGGAAVPAALAGAPALAEPSHVGRYGARVFASALHRVAVINNIPVTPRPRSHGGLLNYAGYAFGSFLDLAQDWLHGSIPHRMAYLHTLSGDPARTGRFDRTMTRLYCVLLFALFASAAWTWMAVAR